MVSSIYQNKRIRQKTKKEGESKSDMIRQKLTKSQRIFMRWFEYKYFEL